MRGRARGEQKEVQWCQPEERTAHAHCPEEAGAERSGKREEQVQSLANPIPASSWVGA